MKTIIAKFSLLALTGFIIVAASSCLHKKPVAQLAANTRTENPYLNWDAITSKDISIAVCADTMTRQIKCCSISPLIVAISQKETPVLQSAETK